MPRSNSRAAPADVEEFAPNRFLVRDTRAQPILKTEGELRGSIFELRSWRREGLIARLRERGITVATLEDQVAQLPGLPQAMPPGPEVARPLAGALDRYSIFDAQLLDWAALEHHDSNGVQAVLIPLNVALRRRRGRGAPSFYLARADRNGALALQPCSEENALLYGFAQAHLLDNRPLIAERDGERIELPRIALPGRHRHMLEHLAGQRNPFVIGERSWPLARGVYAKLGLDLVLEDAR
jgi:hypothetical protein